MESTEDAGQGAGRKLPAQKKSKAREAAGDEAGAKSRFKIDIFRGWCKCCGICAAFCPKGCIRLDGDGSPVVNCEKCTGCGWCELHCPDFAISVRKTDDGGRKTEDG